MLAATGPVGAAQQQAATDLAEDSDIVVTATKANRRAPSRARCRRRSRTRVALVHRGFAACNGGGYQIALITPSVFNVGGNNGIGLAESKAQTYAFGNGMAVFANGSRNHTKTDPVTKLGVSRTIIGKAPLTTTAAGFSTSIGRSNSR